MTADAEARFSEVGTGMMRANPEEASIMRRVDEDEGSIMRRVDDNEGTSMGLRH